MAGKKGSLFAADIKRLVADYKTNVNDVVKQSLQEVTDRVVAGTPVDTGYARATWWTSVDDSKPAHPSPPKKGERGVAGSATGSPVVTVTDYADAVGRRFQLKSSAPYMRRLEYGWSQQAPVGWIRLVLADFRNIVAKSASDVGAK